MFGYVDDDIHVLKVADIYAIIAENVKEYVPKQKKMTMNLNTNCVK